MKNSKELKNDTTYHKERLKFAEQISSSKLMLPHRYVLVLTNKCNLRCEFCFQDKRTLDGAMTAEEWISVIDQFPVYAWVTITGGEPLFFKDFFKVFDHIASRFKCNLISNGLLLSEEIIDKLIKYENFRTLSISIDDIGNVVRDVKPESWRKTENMLQYYARRIKDEKKGQLLDAKTVVLDSNASDLFEIHKYCIEELGCNTHSFQFLKGSPLQHADIMQHIDSIHERSFAPTYKNWSLICDQLNLVREYNEASLGAAYVHPKFTKLIGGLKISADKTAYINSTLFQKDRFMPCKAIWESVHINVDGEVFPCMAISMGNVKNNNLEGVIFSEAAKAIRGELDNKGLVEGCNRCGYLVPADGI